MSDGPGGATESAVTVNPLVAASVEGPKDAWTGVWIAEDIQLIAQGVQNGSWVDTTLGVVGAGLDGLALISDPVGVLLQYGVSWIIEHVKPLSDALDWLAGDPAQIAANAQTWRNIAGSLRDEASALTRAVRLDIAAWTGQAGDAYRSWSQEQQQALDALAKGADAMALITEGAGFLIAAVRMLVRDAIATLVSRLIVYAAEEALSFGLATPLVVEQVTTLIASWAAKIARWLRSLIGSLSRLGGEMRRLGELIEMIKRILGRLRRGRGPVKPSRKPDPNATPRGKRTEAHPTKKKDRPLRRENEAADTLAKHGYDVEQNPPPKPNGKEPDYKIEGEYFDCYSPNTNDLDNIRDQLSKKVKQGQADRLVLNLDDCGRSVQEISDVLGRKPIEGLKEVLVVRGGKVIRMFP